MKKHHLLANLLPLYVEEMKKRLKPTTAYLWRLNIELHFLPYFANRTVEEINNDDLENIMRGLIKISAREP